MEESEQYDVQSYAIADEAGRDDVLEGGLFLELKQYLHQNPQKNPCFISQLLHLLRRSSAPHLQPLLDFSLFPLLVLFDASVNCRSSTKLDSKDNSPAFNTLETEHKVSDAVAEGIVLCLEKVLSECHLGSVDQMVNILKKLMHRAMLTSLEASEKFREGVLRCFRLCFLI